MQKLAAVLVALAFGIVPALAEETGFPDLIYQSASESFMPADGPISFGLVSGQGGGMLVTISMKDGSVTFGENYTPDEAARAFWKAMGQRVCTQQERR